MCIPNAPTSKRPSNNKVRHMTGWSRYVRWLRCSQMGNGAPNQVNRVGTERGSSSFSSRPGNPVTKVHTYLYTCTYAPYYCRVCPSSFESSSSSSWVSLPFSAFSSLLRFLLRLEGVPRCGLDLIFVEGGSDPLQAFFFEVFYDFYFLLLFICVS